MQAVNINSLFSIEFPKDTGEIVDKVKVKIHELTLRIAKMRKEHKVTDAILVDIQNQMRAQAKRGHEAAMTYSVSNAVTQADGTGGLTEDTITIGAGVVNFLLTEQDHVDAEKGQVERLNLLRRNLRDQVRYTAAGSPYVEPHLLNYTELTFLGF